VVVSSESPEIELLQRSWAALARGERGVLEDAFAPDAKWRAVSEGAGDCEGRNTIIEVITRNRGGRLAGSIVEMLQLGPRVIVGFRPEQPFDGLERPLDNGIAYMVVTIDGGKIVELQGCVDRAAAVGYAQTGEGPDAWRIGAARGPEAVEPPG